MPCPDGIEQSPNREKFVAEKLAKTIELWVELDNVERARIIKTCEVYYGASGKNIRQEGIQLK